MSESQLFAHQAYTRETPASPYHIVRAEACPRTRNGEFAERMARVGNAWRAAGVGRVYLLHGTGAGIDPTGWFSEFARWYPPAREKLGGFAKRIVDAVTGERANYTPEFARCFEAAINRHGAERIEVRMFHWTGENHHLGRADGAVRLIDELESLTLPADRRVMLWAHSHGGNVLAIMQQLLAGPAERRQQFFDAARVYYRHPWFNNVDLPVWQRVEDRLRTGTMTLRDRPIDVVTFGTPIRYGWLPRAQDRLLHVIHHRPVSDDAAHCTDVPASWADLRTARHGDYIQHAGIAGTNVPPLFWRAWLADYRLSRLLQPPEARRQFWRHLARGRRVHDAGLTLLVDYGPTSGFLLQHFAGHAVYTQTKWLVFHAEEATRRLYGGELVDVPEPRTGVTLP